MNPAVLLENLAAVPSYHYEPVFAREVRRAFEEFRPTAVALEMPEFVSDELDWAISCWPTPVASEASPFLYPFVPGDSMMEAFRLARERGIDVHLVDLAVADPIKRPPTRGPGAEFAPRVGPLFLEAVDALRTAAGPAADGDVAREAHMAERLAGLMGDYERVLWVGGAAHWPAIRRRLTERDFGAPPVRTFRKSASVRISSALRARSTKRGAFVRMRLAGSALYHITGGRLPSLVSRYAQAPDRYEEAEALQSLALEAVAPDPFPARDVSRVLVYARNLVAVSELSERPSLWELFTAASAVLGERYAARLVRLVLQEEVSDRARDLSALTYEIAQDKAGLRCGDRWLQSVPWPPQEARRVIWMDFPTEEELRRLESGNPYDGLPASGGGEEWPDVFPSDVADYEAFVQLVLRSVAATVPGDSDARPFRSGLRDGIDVRATLRHWHEGELFVREPSREKVQITNAVIDFEGRTESSPFLQGERPPVDMGNPSQWDFWPVIEEPSEVIVPWVESRKLRVGSISRLCRVNETLQDRPFVQRLHRGLSLVTLDRPNEPPPPPYSTSGFNLRVIFPLFELVADPTRRDDLESWLQIFFAFTRGKPVAYFSRYVPGPRVHAVARQHGVRVVHVPLGRIPAKLRERNQTFRIMNLTDEQWEVLRRRVAESKAPPSAPSGGAARVEIGA